MNAELPTPDLSIIIPTFRACRHLERLLDSIRIAPPRRSHEIIVVENASDDGTAAMVRAEFPGARMIAPGYNSGCTGGRNLGTVAARGRYLLFLDSDMTLDAGAADRLADFLDAHPEAGVAGFPLRSPDGTPQSSASRFPTPLTAIGVLFGMDRLPFVGSHIAWRLPPSPGPEPRETDWVSGGASMVRREAVASVGPRDERFFHYAEEMDYYYRIRRGGWRIFQVPGPGAVHFDSVSTRQAPEFFRRSAYESLIWFHEKHGGPWRSLLVRAAVAGRLALAGAVQAVRTLDRRTPSTAPGCRQILRLFSVVVWRPKPGPVRGPAGAAP